MPFSGVQYIQYTLRKNELLYTTSKKLIGDKEEI